MLSLVGALPSQVICSSVPTGSVASQKDVKTERWKPSVCLACLGSLVLCSGHLCVRSVLCIHAQIKESGSGDLHSSGGTGYTRTGGWKGPEVNPPRTAQKTCSCVLRAPQTRGSQSKAAFVATVEYIEPMWKEGTTTNTYAYSFTHIQ